MKIKKLKDVYLFFNILLISLMLLLFSNYESIKKDTEILKNGMYTSDAISLKIEIDLPNYNWNEEIDRRVRVLKKVNFYTNLHIYGIYSSDIIYSPPIIEGHYFNEYHFSDSKGFAVIGKNISNNLLTKIDDKEFFIYNDKNYEVIGIMGSDFESTINNTILLNLNYVDNDGIKKGLYIIDSINIFNKSRNKIIPFEESDYSLLQIKHSDINRYLNIKNINKIYIILMYSLLLAFCIFVINYWIDSKINEIYIRRIIGIKSFSTFISYLYKLTLYLIIVYLLNIIISLFIVNNRLYHIFWDIYSLRYIYVSSIFLICYIIFFKFRGVNQNQKRVEKYTKNK